MVANVAATVVVKPVSGVNPDAIVSHRTWSDGRYSGTLDTFVTLVAAGLERVTVAVKINGNRGPRKPIVLSTQRGRRYGAMRFRDDQRGSAMPMAIGVLVMVMLLTAVAAQVSERLRTTSERDRNAKRALGAADAGVQAAAYRLKSMTTKPTAAQCLLSDALAASPDGGVECSGTAAG